MLQLKALMKLVVAIFVIFTILMPAPTRAVSKHEPTDLLDDDEPEPVFDDFDNDDLDVRSSGSGANAGSYSAKSNDGASAADDTKSQAAGTKPAASDDDDDAGSDGEDESSYYDADEFEGVGGGSGSGSGSGSSGSGKANSKKKSASKSSSSDDGEKKVKITPVNVAPANTGSGSEKPQSWVMESAGVALIVLYIINFLIGRSTNQRIAQNWYSEFHELFASQFAVLGSYEGTSAGTGGLLKESQSVFKFYASGRRHCAGMLITIELKKRHDLFALALALVDLSVTRDTITVEIQMDDDAMEPFVFSVVRRKELSRTKKANKDLENFAGLVESTTLPSPFAVLTDCAELEREFVDDRVCAALRNAEPYFSSLHLTDQNPVYSTFDTRKVLRFKFNMPGSGQAASTVRAAAAGVSAIPPSAAANKAAAAAALPAIDSLKVLMKMAIHFIDRVAVTKLSAAALAKSTAKRKKAAEQAYKETSKQRQEALANRKAELRKKEEEAVANMTPEQLKAKEARDEKKRLKAQRPRVKMIR